MGSGSPACNKRHPYHRCQGRTKRLSLRISETCLCTKHPLWKCSNLLHRSTSVTLTSEKRRLNCSHCSSTTKNAQIRGVSYMDPYGAKSVKRRMQSIVSGPLQNRLAVATDMARLGRFFSYSHSFPLNTTLSDRCPPSMAKVENGRIRTHTLPYSQPNKRKKNTKVNKKRPAQQGKNIENINQRKMNR